MTGNEVISTRRRAVKALTEIFARRRKPKEMLDELGGDIERRERALMMEIVYGVLRHRDYIDYLLMDFLKSPARLSPYTLNNLRTAVYQLLHMRVPEWAAVNEAVNVERELRGRVALVNAVLRRFLKQIPESSAPALTLNEQTDNHANYIALSTSHPKWLVKRWINRFGFDETLRLAQKNNELPPLTIRLGNEAERDEAIRFLKERGISASAAMFSPVGLNFTNFHLIHDLNQLLPFKYIVQDEAAQLAAYLLNPLPGERVLDGCAAPGGKTTHIALMMGDSGEIIAVDTEEKRIKQLEANISKLGIQSVKIILCDLQSLGESGCPLFDRILLDAPCSAIGVIRRNPDVKYRRRAKDLQKFRERQVSLLTSASGLIKPGGVIVYSVCSTEPEEGEEVIYKSLKSMPNFSIIEGEYEFLKTFEMRDEKGNLFYRTYPHRHNMDGFFYACLKRNI
ncbi:MAG: 16S rRNA (cytosine(967)-C(5))-methyltransferase RsmB [Nitrospirae bacterium]|nr:16S rRNA (cytosine(967)-C(5))-methyltransferase RsmB [Nitrospirota bacterium]